MDALEAIGTGVAGAAIFALITLAARSLQERQGSLTGDWLQVTYAREDPKREGEPWSIEWMRIRQGPARLRRADPRFKWWTRRRPWNTLWMRIRVRRLTMSAIAWRIYPVSFDRLWLLEARISDLHVEGVYWAERGEGGDGQFEMTKQNHSFYSGRFMEKVPERQPDGSVLLRSNEQPMVWLRWGSGEAEKFRPLVQKCVQLSEYRAEVPRWIQRRFRSVSASRHRT